MLVWINGPFGGGKTQTAYEIHRRIAGSVICDPELLGFGLHRMMPAGLRGDFQDLAAWRHGVFEVLDLTLKGSTGPVIVPMTGRGAGVLSRDGRPLTRRRPRRAALLAPGPAEHDVAPSS